MSHQKWGWGGLRNRDFGRIVRCWKEVEWRQGLKPWRQGRIIRITLGARQPGKGSYPYMFYFCLILYWVIIGLNAWILFQFALIFVNSRSLPKNRLATMKACQATQPFYSSFSGFCDEPPGRNEEPLGDVH